MTKERLDEISARWRMATPGPWTFHNDSPPCYDIESTSGVGVARVEKRSDAVTISCAPDDIASLLAEVRILRSSRELVAEYAEHCHNVALSAIDDGLGMIDRITHNERCTLGAHNIVIGCSGIVLGAIYPESIVFWFGVGVVIAGVTQLIYAYTAQWRRERRKRR